MENSGTVNTRLSELLQYLASLPDDGDGRIPTLAALSRQLGISTATLREQLEVARMMGIVEVHPKTGIRKVGYSFRSAATTSAAYAISHDPASFNAYSDLRKHLEAAYFIEAAQLLTPSDVDALDKIVKKAQEKLQTGYFQIPSVEHHEFHLLIYRHIENVFVTGILEAYWEVYRASGFEMYPDVQYLQRIWQYHARILDLIRKKDFAQGLTVLLEHMDMIKQRERPMPRQSFE
jgi:DNA-binding FadR family transcriptional regulator